MDDHDHPLELDGETMRALVERAAERIVAHLESLPSQPASGHEHGAELARELAEPDPPEAGTPFDDLLELLFERAIPGSFNSAGPGYLAYIPGGGLFHSAVADLIANATNRYVGAWMAAPGLVQLEVNTLRWLCRLVGFPEEAGGFLITGGSLANQTAVVTARRERLGEDFLRGTLYVSDQVHHSVEKAALLAGFPARRVRRVPSDERFRLRLDELERRVVEDRRRGLEPFLVVASAGTTNTGAIDDLAGAAEIAQREGLWFHVDAAYGGFFMLTERGRSRLGGLERADSITLDPHKGLFLPFGTGSLLVRDLEALRRAHTSRADYMPAMQEDPDFVDFCEISPELSRDFRGLRLWLPIKMHGLGVFRRALDEKLDLAVYAAEELRRVPGIEVLVEPDLSVVVFRLAPPGVEGEELDRLNHELLERVNRRKRVFITGTMARGGFVSRLAILSFRTHRDRIDMALEDIRSAAAELLGEGA